MQCRQSDKIEYVAASERKRNRGWMVSTLQTIAVLTLIVLGLEFLFALAGVGEEEYLKPDPVLGFSPMPNKHVQKKEEGLGRAQYNSFGLPEPERPLEKPARTYRIIVSGDSFVESLQVERQENFCYLLEKDLNRKYPGIHFEVMNFGVAGYSVGQMYLRLKNLGFKFHPDLVILALRSDTTFLLRPTPAIGLTTARPYFYVDENNRLLTDYTVYKQWLATSAGKRMQRMAWLREHSRIYGVVSVAMQQLLAWYQAVRVGIGWGAAVTNKQTAFAPNTGQESCVGSASPNGEKTFKIGNTVVSRDDYYSARDRGIRYFWPIFDGILNSLKGDCSANNCDMLIVQLPGAGGSCNPLETTMLKQTASRLGIPFCDKTAELATEPVGKMYYQIHFTPYGHQKFLKQIEPFVFDNVSELLRKKPVQR